MKKLYKIIVLIIMGVSISSCYYDTFPEEEVTDPGEKVSYSDEIQPLWNSDCVSCHDGGEAPDLRPDISYDVLLNDGWVIAGDAPNSRLYKSLLGVDDVKLMPPGAQWPNSKIQPVYDWIEQGALDN